MTHTLHIEVVSGDLPTKFTYPFSYQPHPLCIAAAEQVCSYIDEQRRWHDELIEGKMFGVMIVTTPEGSPCFIAAFAGALQQSYHHPYFVPPIYDQEQEDPVNKEMSSKVELLTEIINRQHQSGNSDRIRTSLLKQINGINGQIAEERNRLQQSKSIRDLKRKESLSAEQLNNLERESQQSKSYYRNRKRLLTEQIDEIKLKLQAYEQKLTDLRELRKRASANLQQYLFGKYKLINFNNETTTIQSLFESSQRGVPPSGAGDCAGAKLLHYAATNALRPIAMGEFWWGASPRTTVRKHKQFYPACSSRCGVILPFQMRGLTIEPNPLISHVEVAQQPTILYEDNWLIVVNKPHGWLSVPGKAHDNSMLDTLQLSRTNDCSLLPVHRLDMDTSGLLVIAKDRSVHKELQSQFARRKVCKRYIAIVQGEIKQPNGTIQLPLSPDYTNRPQQMVDPQHGKEAFTLWTLQEVRNGKSRILFEPKTGRTHQLRVHAAHQLGLGHPIVGDPLYGTRAERMYLHAEYLSFYHPKLGHSVEFHCPANF